MIGIACPVCGEVVRSKVSPALAFHQCDPVRLAFLERRYRRLEKQSNHGPPRHYGDRLEEGFALAGMGSSDDD